MRIVHRRSALLAAAILAFAVTAGCSDSKSQATAVAATEPGAVCGVSELKANPDQYLGALTLNGKASKVFPGDSVVEIADERACCTVYLFVPFTEEQRAKLGAEHLYKGTLPAVGAPITAEAELTKVERGYLLTVKEIRSGDEVLVAQK